MGLMARTHRLCVRCGCRHPPRSVWAQWRWPRAPHHWGQPSAEVLSGLLWWPWAELCPHWASCPWWWSSIGTEACSWQLACLWRNILSTPQASALRALFSTSTFLPPNWRERFGTPHCANLGTQFPSTGLSFHICLMELGFATPSPHATSVMNSTTTNPFSGQIHQYISLPRTHLSKITWMVRQTWGWILCRLKRKSFSHVGPQSPHLENTCWACCHEETVVTFLHSF